MAGHPETTCTDLDTLEEEEEITSTTMASEPIDVYPLVAEPPPAKRAKNKLTKAVAKAKPIARKSNLSSNSASDKAHDQAAKITVAKERASRMFRERSSTDTTDVSNKKSGRCNETSISGLQHAQLNSPSAFCLLN